MSGKSTRVRISRLNGPQGGGPKKAGLAPLVNIPNSVVRYLRMRGVTTIAPTAGTCVTKEVTGGTFTTQGQLNTLNGCTKINGNLTISGFNSTAPDFSVFSCLKEITGNFLIQNNDALTTISGFSSLATIGSSFNILNNGALTTISSFSSLVSIGGNFNININTALTTISSFSSLLSVVGDFELSTNSILTTISGFSSLVSVGSSFNIQGNGALTTISSFSSLVSIGGNFYIYSNDKLTTISSFSILVSVGGNFTISYNGGTAASSGSPNFITTTISSTFTALRATPTKGIIGTTRIIGADGTHKTSITTAALAKINAASTTITDITTNVVVV